MVREDMVSSTPSPPQEPRTIDEWCEAAKITPVELGRRAGLSRAVIWRHRKGIRAMGELAAMKVERAMREAFDAGNVRVKPLTLEQLCPRLSRRVAPAPATPCPVCNRPRRTT